MAFGESLTVIRNTPADGGVNEVRLAPFLSEQATVLMPANPDDPALRLLSAAERANYGMPPARLLIDVAGDSEAVVWGVHVQDQMLGLAAVRKSYETRVELFMDRLHRGKGIGTLAMAGVLSAALAPRYLSTNEPRAWRGVPLELAAEIHRDNIPAKKLAQSFGFSFYARRGAIGDSGHRIGVYHLATGLAPGTQLQDRKNVGVRQAYLRLQAFTVRGEGQVELPSDYDHLLQQRRFN